MSESGRNEIFISYVSQDRDRVIPIYDFLRKNGFEVWLDSRRLRPGENWNFEIRKALDRAAIIIVVISNNSVNKRGYAQREVKIALEKYEEKLIDDIYIIPILMDDDATIPDQLKGIQFVRSTDSDYEGRIVGAIGEQYERIGAEVRQLQEETSLQWSFGKYHDEWDGLPGYEVDVQTIQVLSDQYPRVNEISELVKGHFIECAMGMRMVKLDHSDEIFNYGQMRERRTNSFDAHCGDPVVKGKILSLNYSIHTYMAGAAHPNQHFQTFCFLLDPLIRIISLQSIFNDSDEALRIIIHKVRQQLLEIKIEGEGEDAIQLDEDVICGGTSDWKHFQNFVFRSDFIEFLFPPYQVAAYAFGPQSAQIIYKDLSKNIKKLYLCALDMEYEAYELERNV